MATRLLSDPSYDLCVSAGWERQRAPGGEVNGPPDHGEWLHLGGETFANVDG